MYLVDERVIHFTYGSQTKRHIRYFYWPKNPDTGIKKQHIYKFDTREEALAAAQDMSTNDVFGASPPTPLILSAQVFPLSTARSF
jgi:hypothetical protein